MSAPVTDADRQAAIKFMVEEAPKLSDWETMTVLSQAIANAREAENRACEAQLRTQADEHERIAGEHPDIAEPQMIRANCLWTEADEIAARRGAP